MASQLKNDKGFVVIEAQAFEFVNTGFGYNGNIYCDSTGTLIPKDETCFYIAVLNRILCKEAFDEWYGYAEWYKEDSAFENKNAKKMFKWLHLQGLWTDENPIKLNEQTKKKKLD